MLYSTAIIGLLSRWELYKIIIATLVQALCCFFLKMIANSLRKPLYSISTIRCSRWGREGTKGTGQVKRHEITVQNLHFKRRWILLITTLEYPQLGSGLELWENSIVAYIVHASVSNLVQPAQMDCLIMQGNLSHHGPALHVTSGPAGNAGAVN